MICTPSGLSVFGRYNRVSVTKTANRRIVGRHREYVGLLAMMPVTGTRMPSDPLAHSPHYTFPDATSLDC